MVGVENQRYHDHALDHQVLYWHLPDYMQDSGANSLVVYGRGYVFTLPVVRGGGSSTIT